MMGSKVSSHSKGSDSTNFSSQKIKACSSLLFILVPSLYSSFFLLLKPGSYFSRMRHPQSQGPLNCAVSHIYNVTLELKSFYNQCEREKKSENLKKSTVEIE